MKTSIARVTALLVAAALMAAAAFAAWRAFIEPALEATRKERRISATTPAQKGHYRDCFVIVEIDYAAPGEPVPHPPHRRSHEAAKPILDAGRRSGRPFVGLTETQSFPGAAYLGFSKNCENRYAMAAEIISAVRDAAPDWVHYRIDPSARLPVSFAVDEENPFWRTD